MNPETKERLSNQLQEPWEGDKEVYKLDPIRVRVAARIPC